MSDLAILRQTIYNYVPGCEQEVQDRRLMLEFLERNPDALLRSNRVAHFTASSWIVDTTGKQTILVYHTLYDSWSWTGGHADGDADLLAVALREAREETGLVQIEPVHSSPMSLEVITVEGHQKHGDYISAHIHLNLTYLLQAPLDQPIRICLEENQGVRWVERNRAISLSTEPKMIPIYQKLEQRTTQMLSIL